MELFDIVKPRPDRNDPEKTHWDPIGVVFRNDEGKMWGSIYAIGDINIFPRKKQGHTDTQSNSGSGPFG